MTAQIPIRNSFPRPNLSIGDCFDGDDENELVYEHGIDEVYSTYQAIVKKYGYENFGEEVDILGLVNRKLNDTDDDSENSYSDSVSSSSTVSSSSEEYSDADSDDDSYTATSSSEG